MGPKTYATNYASVGEKKLSWLDRMCLKLETYYDRVEPGLASPSVLIQKVEVRLNTLGAGVRKFANEANDFVQELLMPPMPHGGDKPVAKVVPLGKQQHSMEVVCDEEKQTLHESHDEMKAGSDSLLLSNITNVELLTFQAEVPFGEVSWNWTLNPLEDSEQQLSQKLRNASCSSMVLTDIPLRGYESEDHVFVDDSVEVESSIEKQERDEYHPRAGGCEAAAARTDGGPSASSSLDGWEGGDIIIFDEDMEPDSWQDWELI